MASRPHPDWSDAQKKVHKQVLEGLDIAVPYFGPEIPSLDNHTDEQLADDTGLIKAARKAFETVEDSLVERLKNRMRVKNLNEIRGNRYVADRSPSERTALDQKKVKAFLEKADDEGIDLLALLDGVIAREISVPNTVFFPEQEEDSEEPERSNMANFHTTTDVSTLRVPEIA